ncbi:MAG: NADH-quinone oxidoreductase subunit NuoE [Bacillota bacterium]
MQLPAGEKEAILAVVEQILNDQDDVQENLIPVLQQVQAKLGYLPGPAMAKIAETAGVPAVEVYGLASFYNQFRLNPPGEHQVKVCMGTACYMAGGRIAMESFERRLAIKEGETTANRKFSLERVACVGCCTMAPVVVVNDAVEGRVTPTRVDGLILQFADQKNSPAQAADAAKREQEGERKY